MSTYSRNGDRVNLPELLEIGKKYQSETDWIPPSVIEKQKKESEDVIESEEKPEDSPEATVLS